MTALDDARPAGPPRQPVTTFLLPVEPPLDGSQAAELARRVFFVAESILDFRLVGEDRITGLEVTATAGTDPAELARKLAVVVANDLARQEAFTPKVVWRLDTEGTPSDVFDELTATGAAIPAGAGQVAFGEPLLSLTDHLDQRVRALVAAEFDAAEFRYPTLIATDVMRRSGYFSSFPQLMMFVSRLHSDVDVYQDFLHGLSAGTDLTDLLRAGAATVDHCLPPTMCYHSFAQLADSTLPAGSSVLTSRGKSFRFESRYERSLERLWDFTIREIVFLGPRRTVLAQRARLMELTFELMAELGLGGRCEVASDPFFINTDTADQVWNQRFLELKYELRLPLEGERDVAVCSFNFHDRFFGRAFAIGAGDGAGPVHTACAGFGLERLAYAFLCRHGVDPAGWPEQVRRAVGS
ncbi:hypothetical protein [Kitasatospora sp. NPDC089509]|uniref:hypothetical protein n=1 Tax=Kitasatospora sp. NPDC089509 TaxID=3364079 RepID=UPI0038186B27